MLAGDAPTVARARRLRRAMSLPEVLLWRELRRRPLGLKFRRQQAAGRLVADFYCHEAQLLIEVDGATHGHPEQAEHDRARDAAHGMRGLRTMRIPARDVLADPCAVANAIARSASETPLRPSGALPLAGEDPMLDVPRP